MTPKQIALKCAEICDEIPLGHVTAAGNRIRAYADTLPDDGVWVPRESSAVAEVVGPEKALAEIAGHVRQIEILCDVFGYDPCEWLADAPKGDSNG